MFEELSLMTWLGAAIVFALGGAVGFFAAYQSRSEHARRLRTELDQTKIELATYRNQVDAHFQKTSQLFGKMTEDYRQVYEHLAHGAQTLCGGAPGLSSLNLPRSKILPERSTVNLPRTDASLALVDEGEPAPPRGMAADAEKGTENASSAPTETEMEAEAAALAEPETNEEPEEVHLGVESASGIDFVRGNDGKTPPSLH